MTWRRLRRPVSHEQRSHALRLAAAGHGHRAAIPEANFLEDATLLTVDEVRGGRHIQPGMPMPGAVCHTPTSRSASSKRQRLEEHAADDAEDGGVGADPSARVKMAISVNIGARSRRRATRTGVAVIGPYTSAFRLPFGSGSDRGQRGSDRVRPRSDPGEFVVEQMLSRFDH